MKKQEEVVLITAESFAEKWDYVSKKIIEVKKKKLARPIVTFVANTLFFVLFTLVTFGALHNIKVFSFLNYLDSIPILADMWEKVESLLYHPEMHWAAQILIYMVFVYLPILVVSAVLFGIVWFAYNPKVEKTRTGDEAVDAKELYKMTLEARERSKKPQPATSVALGLIYLVGILICATDFVGFYLLEFGDTETFSTIMMWYMIPTNSQLVILSVPAIGVLYSAVNLGVACIIKLLYTTRFDANLVDAAENYYHETNPELKVLIEEEDKILARAKEIEARRKQEKEEFESAYKPKPNPVLKKVKLGIKIGLAAIVIGVAIWCAKTVDLDELSKYIDLSQVDFDIAGYFDDSEMVDGTEGTESTEVIEE